MKKAIYIILSVLMAISLCTCSQQNTSSQSKGETRIDVVSESSLKKCVPEDNGMDSNTLKELDSTITDSYPWITSTLVLRHGNIVFEKYYNGNTKESLNEIRSVTKSFTSALIGIALDRGDLESIDQKAVDFFPEYVSSATDPKIKEISIKNLLTMTSGIPYDFNRYGSWRAQDNLIKSALEAVPVSQPGDVFNYSDPGAHLLSGILSKAVKMKTSEYAVKYLFNELDISKFTWPADNQGYNIGAAELTLRTRDMAKFGQLYLNGGKWKDRQVVPAEWVSQSTSKQTNGGAPSLVNYGCLWWVTKHTDHPVSFPGYGGQFIMDDDYPAYYAMVYGGQFIYVVPDLDLVVVITSSLENHHEENRGIVTQYIIPAIKDK